MGGASVLGARRIGARKCFLLCSSRPRPAWVGCIALQARCNSIQCPSGEPRHLGILPGLDPGHPDRADHLAVEHHGHATFQ